MVREAGAGWGFEQRRRDMRCQDIRRGGSGLWVPKKDPAMVIWGCWKGIQ